jgi:hypothetical protein
MDPALLALRDVDFDWVRRLKSVWQDDPAHVSGINRNALEETLQAFARVRNDAALGRVVIGAAGAGKTHLLGALRAAIARTGWFVLVDMTDVRDFWETVLQGFLESLREPLEDGKQQFHHVLQEVLHHLAERGNQSPQADYERLLEGLQTQQLAVIVNLANSTIARRLRPSYPNQALDFQDVLRALLLLNARDFEVSNLGHGWLLGLDLDEEERRACGFFSRRRDAKHVVTGLCWLMSLARPTLLALDQLDAIVGQHTAASRTGESPEQAAAQAILLGLGNGLIGLHALPRALSLLSCLENTWQVLTSQTITPVMHRFERPSFLQVTEGDLSRQLIEQRLRSTYLQHEFRPPYASYPFRAAAFEGAAARRAPREILIDCARHRDECLAAGSVIEFMRFAAEPQAATSAQEFSEIAQRFESLLQSADISGIVGGEGEDRRLGTLVAAACRCVVREQPIRDDRDIIAELDFSSAGHSPALHARLRVVQHAQDGRERHYCFRALNRSHHQAYQNRLRQAMNTAGIRDVLSFRRLVILRAAKVPVGAKTLMLTQEFHRAGGRMIAPDEPEYRRLIAIEALLNENPSGLEAWLRKAQPASKLRFLQESGFIDDLHGEPCARHATSARTESASEGGSQIEPSQSVSKPSASRNSAEQPAPEHNAVEIVIGRSANEQAVGVGLAALTKHTAILASSGSGKTVLLRRILEEAALRGVPSIVIDAGNDLARLGDAWPQLPASWKAEDSDVAARYLQAADVCIWTPGALDGRPINLTSWPDFTALTGEEREQALEMARGALEPMIAGGRSRSAERSRGVLARALRHFAQVGSTGLEALIGLLSQLPPAASSGDSQDGRFAAQMGGLLRSQGESNPLWQSQGTPLSPAALFGTEEPNGRTRVSVINLSGLASLEEKQAFVNALAMVLFSWISRNRASSERPLRGLLAFDEAKDFVPTGRAMPCKDSLLKLVRQGRKYGLGMIFATQEPPSIDHAAIANCTTQIHGKASSPSAIERMRSQLQVRGGRGDDIAQLRPGEFYVSTDRMPVPLKTATHWCLSWHPDTPLDTQEVMQRAQRAGQRSP